MDQPSATAAQLAAAALLGLAAALGIQMATHPIHASGANPVAPGIAAQIRAECVDDAVLQPIVQLRDDAESLTHAEVLLDERARERWLPVMPELRRQAEDPEQPVVVRMELEATLAALERAGI